MESPKTPETFKILTGSRIILTNDSHTPPLLLGLELIDLTFSSVDYKEFVDCITVV